jgi:hypothetical protein
MIYLRIIVSIVLVLFVCQTNARQSDTIFNPHAPIQLTHWQKMLGNWRTSEESLKADGSGWKSAGNADWHFYSAMNGWAVRDEYFSPPLSESVEQPNKRQIGTNLRVFDRDKQQWLMAWITKEGNTVDTYSAESDNDLIVMLSKHKTPQGKYARITFFDMQQDSFEWKLEWSDDGKNNWLEVYRIHGKRVK